MQFCRQFALSLVVVCTALTWGCASSETTNGPHFGSLSQTPPSKINRVKTSLSAQASKLTAMATPKAKLIGAVDPISLSTKIPKIGADMYVAHARSLEALNNSPQAANQYAKALEVDPNDLEALLGYAHLLDRHEKKTEATLYYERAVKAHPQSGRASNDLALCYARRGMDQRALTALRRAVELSPKKKLYRNNIAAMLIDQGEQQQALHHLGAVYDRATAHYNVAYLLNKQGNSQQALRHFQEAARLSPSMTAAHSWIANLTGRPPSRIAQRQNNDRPPTVDRRNVGNSSDGRWQMSPRGQGQIQHNRAFDQRIDVSHRVPPTDQPNVRRSVERESLQRPETPVLNPAKREGFSTPATPIRLPSTVRRVTYAEDLNAETPPLPDYRGLRLSSRDDGLDDLFPEDAPNPN